MVHQVEVTVSSALGRTILRGCVVARDRSADYPIGVGLVPSGFSGSFAEWFSHSVLVDRVVDCLYIVYICVLIWY